MASFSSIPKTHFHARSISLPSRSNQLSELDDSIATTSSSSSSIGQKISDLNNLFTSVDHMLLLPTTQRALAQEGQNNAVNELLDELPYLLDLCSAAKDALLMTRNSAQELQSVPRRKRGNAILKTLKNLTSSSTNKIQQTAAVVSLREVELVSFNVLKLLLCMSLGTNSKKWYLFSKLMGPKRVACDESPEISLVEDVDVELAKKSTSLQVENVQKELAQFEMWMSSLQRKGLMIIRSLAA